MRSEFLLYCRPMIEEAEIASTVDSMRRGWLTTGPKVAQFEVDFARMSGVSHAIALSSGTAALHLGLIALGLKPGDEVIMPSLTFVAGANCVRQLGGIPIFCDVDPQTLCLSVDTIERVISGRTRLIIPMHYAGRPAGVQQIADFAHHRNIAVLEDAALAVGTLDSGRWAGSYSDGAAYSFYATKNITTGEGGMFVTNNADVSTVVRRLSLHGIDRDAWKRYTEGGTWTYDVVSVGYKYNMSDLAGGMGTAQLGRLAALQSRRDEIAKLYVNSLRDIPGISPATDFVEAPNHHSWCIFPILIDEDEVGISRADLIRELHNERIGTSVHYIPTHTFEVYRDRNVSLPTTEALWTKLISLPLYPSMTNLDAEDVMSAVYNIVSNSRRRARKLRVTHGVD